MPSDKPTPDEISRVMAELSGRRKTKRGGRPPKPTKCSRCGARCRSAREAWRHCAGRALATLEARLGELERKGAENER